MEEEEEEGGADAETDKKVCQISLRKRRKKKSGEVGKKSGRISPLSSGRRGWLPLGGRPAWLGLRLVNHSAAASVAG